MIDLSRRGRWRSLTPRGNQRSALIEAGAAVPELRWFCDFSVRMSGFRYGMCHVPEVLANFNLTSTSFYNRPPGAGSMKSWSGLSILETDQCGRRAADSRQWILGTFGWPMLRVLTRRKKHWNFLTVAFMRRVTRRCAEVVEQRFFPNWLARFF